MSILTDVQPYIDPVTGGVNAADGGTDDQFVFTAILLQLCTSFGDRRFVMDTLSNMLNKTIVEGMPGLYARYPGATDNSVDNYIGIVQFTPVRVIYYGSQHWWSFAVEAPGKFQLKDCYLRFIGFRPYVYMANNNYIMPWSQVLYVLACLATLFTDETDVGNVQLQWLMNRAVKGKHWIVDAGIKLWQFLALKKWPGGMKRIFTIYNGSDKHPFVTYGPEDFG